MDCNDESSGLAVNGGLYYEPSYRGRATWIQSVHVWRVIKAADERERRLVRVAGWLNWLGVTL